MGDLGFFCLRNILADADNADDVSIDIASRGRVEEDINLAFFLGEEGKLVVGGFGALESILQDITDGVLEVIGDEIVDEIAAHDL